MDSIDLSIYEKKSVHKSDKVKELLRNAMAENCLFKRCRVRLCFGVNDSCRERRMSKRKN